jgi:hypothetical protein
MYSEYELPAAAAAANSSPQVNSTVGSSQNLRLAGISGSDEDSSKGESDNCKLGDSNYDERDACYKEKFPVPVRSEMIFTFLIRIHI